MNYDALAQLYQWQYANYRDDIDFYARLAQKLGVTRVLEIGAGSGRVSVALARRGFEVIALEPSQRMITLGRAYAASEGVTVDFRAGDVRHFDLNERFDVIIAPFNMLMHLYTLGDQDDALERIDAHLNSGGTFAFDLFQPRFGPEGVLRHEDETFWQPDGSRLDVFLKQRIDTINQIVSTTYYCDTIHPNSSLTREVLELRQRYFTRFELERWFQNFRLELLGDFDGSRLTADSPAFIGLARR
jgi:SAM-dependent methyltransferase